jgi:pimeloyl-ACP methyl ester carboxylesterase/heme-degrading monooxygenase HmoA
VNNYEVLKTGSRIAGLNIAVTHCAPGGVSKDYPVLFLHGSSFPSALAFAFRMNGYSWIDHLSENGYDVYALDFLGYGRSDRYPEMYNSSNEGRALGRASEVYADVGKAIELILARTGKKRVNLIAHSWGGLVALIYAAEFPDKIAKLVLFAAITERNNHTQEKATERLFDELTPGQRITAMKNLTPAGHACQLEPEIFDSWGRTWLHSDTLAEKFSSDHVRFPAGYSNDIYDLSHGNRLYNASRLKAPVLIIRGEWDQYPNNTDAANLFTSLTNVPYKKYIVIQKGTHVMHLEKSRYELYDETLRFLDFGNKSKKINKHAVAVIFEVIPAEGKEEHYLNIALTLKPELEKIKGFISVERFKSIYHPEKILSLSFWENEEAIKEWRNLEVHRDAQTKGREYIFTDYHLRIAGVIRDYGMFDREEAPDDSRLRYH